MVIQEKRYTAEEFWDITQLPENEQKRLELVDGSIYEKGFAADMASSSKKNTVVAGRVLHFLNAFVIPRDLGYVAGADGGFQLSESRVLQPDTAFISRTRMSDLEGTTFDGSPDIAVEVISPGETARKVMDKTRMYLDAGAAFVWNIYTDEQLVDICHMNDDGSMTIQTLTVNDTLSGGNTLPGFTLPVRDIFPA